MQKIIPYLWFNGRAEEAMNHYVSTFAHSKVGSITRYGDHGPGPKGSVMMATFQLEGQEFMALNGGPKYPFTPAISLYVNCETQEEIDRLWTKLCEGGAPNRCGWLVDKFGVSWQIIPRILGELMTKRGPDASGRVMKALLGMDKMDLAALQAAANGP